MMSRVAVARSYSTVISIGPPGTRYGLLGPFYEGTVLREVWIEALAQATGSWAISMALTASAEASAVAMDSGSSIIERSTGVLAGHPSLYWMPAAGGQWRFRIPVGVAVHSGSRYVVFAVSFGGAGTASTILVSARMGEVLVAEGRRESPKS